MLLIHVACMKKDKKIMLITLALLCHSLLYSEPADTTSVIDNIYNYDFIKASEKLSGLNERDPLIGEALNLEISWWMAMERGDKDRFSGFLKTLDQFEKTGNHGLTDIISSTYRMRYYACLNKNYMIPLLFMKVQRQIDKVDITGLEYFSHEGCELFMLYKSFLALVRYNYFIDKFLPDSDRKKELISDIENVIRNGSSPNRTIGRYFLMKYYLDIAKDKPRAFGYLALLHKQYPGNLIFTQLLIN